MANQLANNPWYFDTASATPVFTHQIKLAQIEYLGYLADTDVCIVTDKFGNVIWKANGSADLQVVRSGKIGWVAGLAVTQIDNSGGGARVAVYFE